MKRLLYISLLCLLPFCMLPAQNTDPHLKRLIECINNSDLVCATKELPMVEDWTYNEDYKIDDVDNYTAFIKYIQEIDSASNLNNFNLYYADQLQAMSDFCHDNNDLHKSLYYLQLIEDLELEKSKKLRFTDILILTTLEEILEKELNLEE